MALSSTARRQFVDAYSHMLLTSWGDEAYAARLAATNPVAAVAEAGVELPSGARVTIVRHTADQIASAAAGSGDLEAQIALYEAGLESGDFVFHVPDTPVLDNEDLNVEDLSAVSAGTTYCCCCCPACSSCTI